MPAPYSHPVIDAWTLMQHRRKDSGAQPLITYVDAGTGERTELSAISLENAAAKIANALRDEYGLEPGARIGIHLPLHWQRATWCAGAWTAGCALWPGLVDADLVVADVTAAAGLGGGAGRTVAVSLHPMGLPITSTLPHGVSDATVAVLSQPDAYLFEPPASSTGAFGLAGRSWTQDEILHLAAGRATDWGLGPGGRLLVTETAGEQDGWLAALAVPLVARASVVLVGGEGDVESIAERERATAVATS